MDPMKIALIVLAAAGVWAVVELALVLRRARGVVDSLDKTVEQVNSTIEEARPVVAKLDGVVDELQPAVAQIEPLLKQATVAVEALSADLVEVNGVLRDVSAVSGAASSASNAVTGLADAASEKVHKLFAKPRKPEHVPAAPAFADAPSEPLDRSLDLEPAGPEAARDDADHEVADADRQYFTYATSEETDHE
mgnify:CR=1 FL=1